MEKGLIIKAISGFYYVKINNYIVECKAKGKFRKDNISPLVGDYVLINTSDFKYGIIMEVLPRKTMMIRPNVANIEQLNIVFSIKNPDVNLYTLDKLIILSEFNNINPVICINKCDIGDEKIINNIYHIYSDIGYEVIKLSSKTNEGITDLRIALSNKISAFAGPSGVGKSSIYNLLQDKIKMEIGSLSEKILRGKNTTRHAELIDIDDKTFIVDTPGFTCIEVSMIKAENLQLYFKEFNNYVGECKFNSCIHDKEKDCMIKDKVNEKLISKTRYESYINMLNEIRKK